jgi:hypothetical protein
MASAEKNLQKMRNNPRDWRMEDLKVIAKRLGIEYRHHGTSHVAFKTQGHLVVVPDARPILPVYIRKFVALIDSLEKPQ